MGSEYRELNGSKDTVAQHTMDSIFTLLGFGPWNALCCSMSFLVEALFAVVAYGSDFMVPPHPFDCVVPGDLGVESSVLEDSCSVTLSNGSHEQCQNFTYTRAKYINTVTMEFDLVCSREKLRFVFQLMITAGGLFGTVFSDLIVNNLGRQKTIWICSLVVSTFIILNVTVPIFWVIMATRFLVGFFIPTLHMASFVLGLEACPLKYRTFFGTLSMTPFAVMVSCMAVIAYFLRDWRQVQLFGSWPLLLLVFLANPLLLSESPRWLVSRGRVEEAARILVRAAKKNKTSTQLPEALEKHLNCIYEEQVRESYKSDSARDLLWSLLSSPEMRLITFGSAVLFVVHGSMCMSIPLRATAFGSEFVYVMLLGVVQLLSYLTVGPVVDRCGRTLYIVLGLTVAACIQLILTALLALNVAQGIASSALSAAAFGATEGAYLANLVLASELFPTSVRSLGMALCYFALSIGYMLPSILDSIRPASMPWLSPAVFGALSAVGAVTVQFLPDTNKMPLLQAVPKHYSR